MAQNYTGGYGSYVNYGFETTYGTAAATHARVFGSGQKVSITRRNNMERIYGVGSNRCTWAIVQNPWLY